MNMNNLKGYIFLVLMCFGSMVAAQTSSDIITDFLSNNSQGKVTINQPENLKSRLKQKKMSENENVSSEESTKVVGYRVQVFSDNNQRTAKSQAQSRERNILAQFPDLKVYLIYKSPSWRVRVGDYKSRGEAEQVMQEIKEAFPSYAGEVMVVVDRINLQEK